MPEFFLLSSDNECIAIKKRIMSIPNLLYYSYLRDQRHKLLLEFEAGVFTCVLSRYFGFQESNLKTTKNAALRFPVTKTAKD